MATLVASSRWMAELVGGSPDLALDDLGRSASARGEVAGKRPVGAAKDRLPAVE